MGQGKPYQVIVTRPATSRYQQSVLHYLYDNFSFDRAYEIDAKILKMVKTLGLNPHRGRRRLICKA